MGTGLRQAARGLRRGGRGCARAQALFFAALHLVHLSRWAEDLIIYSSGLFKFVQCSDAYATGAPPARLGRPVLRGGPLGPVHLCNARAPTWQVGAPVRPCPCGRSTLRDGLNVSR